MPATGASVPVERPTAVRAMVLSDWETIGVSQRTLSAARCNMKDGQSHGIALQHRRGDLGTCDLYDDQKSEGCAVTEGSRRDRHEHLSTSQVPHQSRAERSASMDTGDATTSSSSRVHPPNARRRHRSLNVRPEASQRSSPPTPAPGPQHSITSPSRLAPGATETAPWSRPQHRRLWPAGMRKVGKRRQKGSPWDP